MGGPSAEHEVSLNSGREVLTHLDRDKWNPRAVVISKEKEFFFCDPRLSVPELEDLRDPKNSSRFRGPYRPSDSSAIWKDCNCAFLALHGAFGEDGRLQGYLESIGMPYTGSGVYASAVGMNKVTSKTVFERAGLTTPPSSVYGAAFPHVTLASLSEKHSFPCFVKCPQSGSSRLMGRATDRESLKSLLDELSAESDQLLVESYIEGIEFSCPVLETPNHDLEALPPVEIRPKNASFFDYEAKYASGGSDEIVPIPHGPELVARIQQIALTAHRVLGCRGMSRTDMILKDDTLYVLEINTLPGLTSASLAPKSYQSTGRSYSDLLSNLVESALSL